MISNIYVKNFILIDELSLDLNANFSCFSGETGAGKSLLIDAIALLCGAKTSSSYIQKGADKAFVEATIEIDETHPSYTILEEAGFVLEDNSFIISREISTQNKSANKINYRNVSVSLMKSIMENIIDIHSQHDNQYLLNKKYHITLLDNYVNQPNLLVDVDNAYKHYHSLQLKLDRLLNKDIQNEDLDYLNFQLDEINALDLQENEFEELQSKEKLMSAYEHEVDIINHCLHDLKSIDSATLYECAKSLQKSSNDVLHTCAEQILSMYYCLDEQIDAIVDYQGGMEFNEKEYDEIQSRLFDAQKVLRKHGPTYTELMQHKFEIEDKINSIVNAQEYIDALTLEVDLAYHVYVKVAKQLSEIRKKKALELQQQIQNELVDLSLSNAIFDIEFSEKHSSKGMDDIEFMISMNKGETVKPLAKVASGGELSRLMLGLKTIFSQLSSVTTLIFDEIDNGVSGNVAYMIGKKMNVIAKQKQVFSVTHLAPVACWANYHYLVEKNTKDNQTISHIKHLNEEQTIHQLAMISFAKMSDQALLASKELYDSCLKDK